MISKNVKSARWQLPILHQRTGLLTDRLNRATSPIGLGSLPVGRLPDTVTKSVCGFCSTGCGLNIHMRDGVAINVTPDHDYPVNTGMACPKGWESLRVLDSHDRATTPLLRQANGKLQPIDWGEAATTFCDRFKAIQGKYGSDSVAFISTGQIATEEMFFLGCLTKFGMGVLHGDGNTRQCMATSAVAYKQAFGFDAPPFTYADLEQSDVLVFVGANPCLAHPIIWQRVLQNPNDPTLIVIDPRKTETAMAADEHLALLPKSDLTLLYGLANLLIEAGAVDQAFVATHTQGFSEFREHVLPFDAQRVAKETGLSESQVQRVVQCIAKGKRVSFWWTMGVNQSYQGVRTAQAIINLALCTGNIGRPGTGANSITGQCNAMGSRLYSNTTSLLGLRDFTNLEDRRRVAEILSIPVDRIPVQNSLAYDQIIAGIETGRIRGLWIVATNTAHSWIGSSRANELLAKLDFLVVQDIYHSSETAKLADLVLPAAGWGEKEGTFINSERRIGTIKRVARAPGQALADFSILRLLADTWGCGELFSKWQKPADVFEAMKQISAGRACDITGIDGYATLDRCGGVQWPWTAADAATLGTPPVHRRLFEDGRFYHNDGRARFIFTEPRSVPEPTCAEFPFTLLTGRGSVSQWHTETRTAKSPILRKLSPPPNVEVNPTDARELDIRDGDLVEVGSRRGRAVVRACVTSTVQPKQLFMAMHDVQTNLLTLENVDPESRQPCYKHCAVALRRANESLGANYERH
jgi:predicted molibdopterin-dependent oxidoreductase YjgC